jgi:hypothetical protein
MEKKKKEKEPQCNIAKLIALIILLVTGSYVFTYNYVSAVDIKANRIIGVEAKLDMIIDYFGIKKNK